MALGIAFFTLSFVADEHLSPSLQQLSKTFKLSESLAGVTLLAFGAGAPDVFASISASTGGDPSGIQMGISVLLGSSLFILAVVTSCVILSAPESIQVKKPFFIRDTAFLLLALLLLLHATLVKEQIDLAASLAFVGLYASYVLVVLCQDRFYSEQEQEPNTELSAVQSSDCGGSGFDYDFEAEFTQTQSAGFYSNELTQSLQEDYFATNYSSEEAQPQVKQEKAAQS